MSNPASIRQPLFHHAVPGLDLSLGVWFDDWSEGPYDLHEILHHIAQEPGRARCYHVVGRPELTYAFLFPNGPAIAVDPCS